MESEEGSSWVDSTSDASESTSTAPSESDSTASSRCSSTVSYEYDPNDFPRACEIEEFQSPSFEWPSSRSLSRSQSEARPASIQYSNLPKGVAAKLQTRMNHLNMLLILSASAGVVYNNTTSTDTISNSQQALDKTCAFIAFIAKFPSQSKAFTVALKAIVAGLETAIANMSELLKEKVFLLKPIQLADLVVKTAGRVPVHRRSHGECQVLKVKAERLARLLWKASHTDLYGKPVRLIMADTTKTLHRALGLVNKYNSQGNLVRRTFTNILVNAFMEIPMELDNAINNISWLIRVSVPSASPAAEDEDIQSNLDLPPLATKNKKSTLFLVWKQVAKLLKGSPEDKAQAAAALAAITDINRFGMIIIEQGGLEPLLKLVKGGMAEAQESAACALGLLSRVPKCAEVMVPSGDARSIFTDTLKRSPLMGQGMVVWAVSELAAYNCQRQDRYRQNDVVDLLVEQLLSENNMDGATFKVMAIGALLTLAQGNGSLRRLIINSRVTLQFPILLEKWKLECNTARAVADQLLQIVRKPENNRLLLPCITALGCLSEIFSTNDVIRPLVRLLDDLEWEDDVVREATTALAKFAGKKNHMQKSHCKTIVAEGGLKHLVKLVKKNAQKPALLLLCYVTIHDTESEEMEKQGIVSVLEWAAMQDYLVQDATVKGLIEESRDTLVHVLLTKWNREAAHSADDDGEPARLLLVTAIQLAYLVAETAGKTVQANWQWHLERQGLKRKVERVTWLLWKVARTDLYKRPIQRIMADTMKTLNRALEIAEGNGAVSWVFGDLSAYAFTKMRLELDNTISNISWLIRMSMLCAASSAALDDEDMDSNLPLPPFATKEPTLCVVWKWVAMMVKGTPHDKIDAATALASVPDMSRFGKIFIEVGGLEPLLRLVKEGMVEAQESAASALGLLSRESECAVDVMLRWGDARSLFTDALKQGPLVAEGMVVWAVSELAIRNPQSPNTFTEENLVELLVQQLLYENSKVVGANHESYRVYGAKNNRKLRDPSSNLKIMAALTLCTLARGNPIICRLIVNCGLMVHFPFLLGKRPRELQSCTATLLLEIARMAEVDADLRSHAFDLSSPVVTAVLEKLLQIVRKATASSELLVTCIATLGCFSETLVRPLVQLHE